MAGQYTDADLFSRYPGLENYYMNLIQQGFQGGPQDALNEFIQGTTGRTRPGNSIPLNNLLPGQSGTMQNMGTVTDMELGMLNKLLGGGLLSGRTPNNGAMSNQDMLRMGNAVTSGGTNMNPYSFGLLGNTYGNQGSMSDKDLLMYRGLMYR